MLREIRRLESRELSASHVAIELRTPDLRVALHHGHHVASDFALLARIVVRRASTRRSPMRSIEELGDALRLNQRMIAAIRWLGAPGATTELVARLGGARSPTGLCHVFADAGLPSPGALAKAARRDVLAAWVDHAAPTHHAHAT